MRSLFFLSHWAAVSQRKFHLRTPEWITHSNRIRFGKVVTMFLFVGVLVQKKSKTAAVITYCLAYDTFKAHELSTIQRGSFSFAPLSISLVYSRTHLGGSLRSVTPLYFSLMIFIWVIAFNQISFFFFAHFRIARLFTLNRSKVYFGSLFPLLILSICERSTSIFFFIHFHF